MTEDRNIGFWRHAEVYALDPGRLLVRYNFKTYILKDEHYVALAPLLDGSLDEDEIVSQLSDRFSPEHLYYALMRLQSNGHVVPIENGFSPAQTAFWHARGVSTDKLPDRFAANKVKIESLTELPDKSAFESHLADNGLCLTADSSEANWVLVLTDDYLKIDPTVWDSGTRWLPVLLSDSQPWVGPVFSGNDIRWRYLKTRLEQNTHAKIMFTDESEELFRPHPVEIGSGKGVGIGFAATEVTLRVTGDGRGLDDLIVFDIVSNQTRRHPVPNSGALEALDQRFKSIRNTAVIELTPRPKAFTRDGGFRSVAPEITLARIEPFISSLTGVVPEPERMESRETIHVYATRGAVAGASFVGVGKGASMMQSKASCCAEALERYCAQYRGDEPTHNALLRDLGDAAIHPERLLHFSNRQYDDREHWNETHAGFNWVPERFDDSQAIDWTPVWSLTTGVQRWVPSAYCYHSYPKQSHALFCRGDSNGCAAGNNLEEAILQGLFELVERDAAALWWYNQIPREGIDLESLGDGFVGEVLQYHEDLDRHVAALDLTTDLGIPVVVAVAWNRSDGANISLALGSHLDFRLAVSRALSELNQMSVYQQLLDPEESHYFARHEHEQWINEATISNQLMLKKILAPTVRASDYQTNASEDLCDDLQLVMNRLEDAGLETLVLDLTREDCPLSVVRTIVPGLRHFWARYAPGRLYDVPVSMGWQSSATREQDLNPIPLFI